MGLFLTYLKSYKKESILGPLFKLLEASFELFIPLVIASIVDVGIENGDKPYIVRMCLLLVALAVIGLVCAVTAQYFAAKAATGVAKNIRGSLFAHIGTLSYTELDTVGTSTLITRMTSDVNQVQSGINLTLRLLLRSPFVVFGAMIMAFTVDGSAAVTFAVTIPLLCLVVFGIMLASIPLYKKVQGKLDRVLGMTRRNLTGVRVIRAFCREDEEIEEFDRRNEELTAVQKFVGRISALMNPVTYIIINLATLILIHRGALQVHHGDLTQGEVIALYNYMSQILVELIKMANLIISITKAVACGHRIEAVMKKQSSMAEGSLTYGNQRSEPAVEFRGATLRYAGAGENSLNPVNLSVRHGEVVGIIGGTGSGKTSLVNLIPRFYDVSEGELLVNGVNVKDYKTDSLRERIGVVPQKAVLFKGSIRDNMRYGNENATDEEITRALAIAQASAVVAEKEGGLDYEIEQGGKNLSGGQRQRLTIARALVKNPDILILDDSASALDYATDAALRRALKESLPGTTVFIVSQRTASIMHADRIVVLDDGEVVGMGRHEELLEGCPTYREIYESQFKKEDAQV
ncbi:MAG: ABC transporter ATP-binding protein [Clostridia bacterium]|nr:ABC transporter ATP-binding protein [Clostridia bacterium]